MTAEEYQVAQIYMTARAQSMEAEQEDGAGVEVVESYATTHPKLGCYQPGAVEAEAQHRV